MTLSKSEIFQYNTRTCTLKFKAKGMFFSFLFVIFPVFNGQVAFHFLTVFIYPFLFVTTVSVLAFWISMSNSYALLAIVNNHNRLRYQKSLTKYILNDKVFECRFGCIGRKLISNWIAHLTVYGEDVNRAQKLRYDLDKHINSLNELLLKHVKGY